MEDNSNDIERILFKLGRGWEFVGYVAVDAGLIWVGDPCYCVTPDASSHPAKTWEVFCEKLDKAPDRDVVLFADEKKILSPGNMTESNTGIAVSSGYGDGSYPVFVKREGDRIAAVHIEFM